MLTPKQKARQLFNRIRYIDNESGKDCITCDCVVLPIVKFICNEIINKNNENNDYWKEVLTEIENL